MEKKNRKEKNRNRKGRVRIMSLLLAASMILALAGCGRKDAGGGQGGDGANADAGTGQTQGSSPDSADGTTAMGRYVEEETDLSEQLKIPCGMCRRQDGSLVILNAGMGYLVSQDEGVTWEEEVPDWFLEMKEKGCYIADIAMSPDGTVGVLYDPVPDDDYTTVMDVVWPDGTQIPVEIALTEEDMYIRQMEMTQDNRIIIRTVCGNLYEVHKDGSGELLLGSQSQERPSTFCIKGNRIFMDRERTDTMPVVYDMDAGEYIEDDVLTDFIRDNYGNRYYNGLYDCTMYMLPDENQSLYLIGSKGIHRHVIGGNMMEQVVDGSLSMLNNPYYTINSALLLEGDVFLVLFANGKLLRFTYDPDVPAVPENVLTIYSLREDEDMRQAISLYQSQNPDIFVSYEIGMAEGSSITREDAVKKLNTEIMAGTGPDLLVMDDLPFASYVEKGLLLDITEYLEKCSADEPLFDNIIDALKKEGKAYVASATIKVPIVLGREDALSNMTDLSDIGEIVEALRKEHPGDNIIGICSAEGVMNRFAPVSAPTWITADGAINRENIGEFLEQGKRIYDAQMDGIQAEIVQFYAEMNEYYVSQYGINANRMNWRIASDLFNYLENKAYLLSGWLDDHYAYAQLASLERTKGYEDSVMKAMQGHCSQVFEPQTLLGISAASSQIDMAERFMGFFLSADVQENYSDFPLNKEAYDRQFTPDEKSLGEDGAFGMMGMSTEDGTSITFTIYWPDDEKIAALKEELASADTAYVPDSVLEDAVFLWGSAYMNGQQTLEQTLDEIERQVAIYMAE